MISAFVNAFKIEELKKRIIFTAWIVFITRLGASIPVPGVDATALQEVFKKLEHSTGSSFLAMLNIFSGGALEHLAVFSLTVMPYISASIIFQLLVAVVPTLAKISKEEGGRQKISQYTRYSTVLIGLFQSFLLAKGFEHPETLMRATGFRGLTISPVVNPGPFFIITTMITLTAGTIFMMWLGEQITERGIGNGVSMLIATNILARFPGAIGMAYRQFFPEANTGKAFNPIMLALFIGMFLAVVAGVIVVTQAQRKITIQHAQRMVGRRMTMPGQQFLPLRVNYSGVMPIIFAQAIIMLPQFFASLKIAWIAEFSQKLNEGGGVYMVVYPAMIFFFSYFWVATVFNPLEIADNLKKSGGYVPGVRPGKPTADFLEYTMVRITFAGAVFLTIIAVFPTMLNRHLGIPMLVASFFGGTSLLIVVGVLLDMLRQMETYLITRNYEGFLKKGRMRGRI